MRGDRDHDESKLQATEITLTSDNKVLNWLSNFWYYHKWKVIVIAFFAIILVVGVIQIIDREDVDEVVIVAVPADISAEDNGKIDSILTQLAPNKKDGSAKNLSVYAYPIYSEDELKEANESETDEEGRFIPQVLPSYNTSKLREYDQFLSTGECSVMLISEFLYSRLTANNRLLPVGEVCGSKLPEGVTKDGYGVRLGNTYLYEYFPELQKLPADTIVCISRQYIHGASSNDDRYADSEELFKNIVTFGN